MAEKSLNELPRDLRALFTKGKDALQRDNFDYAIELFNQILAKEPAFFECRHALRNAQLKKSGNGGGFLKKMWGNATSSPLVAKGQLALRRDPTEALQIAEQILNDEPTNSGAHKLVVEAADALELPRTAVMSLEILVRNSPKDKDVAIRFANRLADTGEAAKAEKILADLYRSFPTDAELGSALKDLSARKTMVQGGYAKLADGSGSYRDILANKEEAVSLEQQNRQVKTEDITEKLIKEYEARLKTEPDNLKLLRSLGEMYTSKKQFDKALSYYDQIKSTDVGGGDAALDRNIADTTVKKFDHLMSELDKDAPDYADKLAGLQAGKQAFQLAECQKRAERFPTDLQIRFELGQLYFQAGKISEAVKEFQKAQSNPHRRIQAMSFLGQCFARRGIHDLAATTLQDAIKEKVGFDEEKKELHYVLGCVFEKMGKREDAIAQFKIIYAVDSSYKDVGKKVEDYYSSQGG
ncbi:Tetratricopeptide domain protein [Verrucomicrobia bacterium]|nr:Tetratricopeptide domain protein [Verrucomicrobiota bacterium]